MQRAELVRAWREAAKYAFMEAGPCGLAPRILVTIHLAFYRDGRKDAMNYVGTAAKAIVDGMIDAGCLPDDNDDYVAGVWCVLRKDPDNMVCRVEITEGL